MLAPGPRLYVACCCLLLDLCIYCSYGFSRKLKGGTVAFFGCKVRWHIAGGVANVTSGGLAILLHPNAFFAGVHGLSALLLCGPTAILLSNHTAGLPGITMTGYALAGAIWTFCGARVLLAPTSLPRLFEAFVFGHAFSIVRLTFFLQWALRLPGEREPLTYTVVALTGLLACMVAAWGAAGAGGWALLLAASLAAAWGGGVRKLHVSPPGDSRYRG